MIQCRNVEFHYLIIIFASPLLILSLIVSFSHSTAAKLKCFRGQYEVESIMIFKINKNTDWNQQIKFVIFFQPICQCVCMHVCTTVLCAYSTEPFFCIHSLLKSNANSRLYICFVVVSVFVLLCDANAYSFSLWMFLTYKFYLDKRLCMVFTDDFFDCNAHCEWNTSKKTFICFFFKWFIYNFSLRYYWEQSDLNLDRFLCCDFKDWNFSSYKYNFDWF